MSDASIALAVQQPAAPARVGLLRPIAPTGEIIRAQEEARTFIASALLAGRDYGVVPGTGKVNKKTGEEEGKATLLKPGSERICAAFGVRVVPTIVEMEVDHDREVPWTKRKKKWRNAHKGDREFTWEAESGVSQGLYRYVVRCDLFHIETGALLGSGIGSASTMESKYVDRPRESENTVLKMAKKRAQIDGVLTTFGLSDQFTQDLDDFREDFTAEAGVDHQPAVVMADDDQLAELRALAKKIHRTTVQDLEAKIREGIPSDAVPVVFERLKTLLREKEARKAGRGAQEEEPAEGGVRSDLESDLDRIFGEEGP